MNWFKSAHTQFLEREVERLHEAVSERDTRIKELTDRLLIRERVPETPEQQHRTNLKLNDFMQDQFDVFKDLDGGDEDENPNHILNPVSELVQDEVGRP